MSKSLQKFQSFLNANNIVIRHIVCEKDNVLFMVVFSENLHEFMIVTINQDYKMTRKDIDIHADVINVETYHHAKETKRNFNIDYTITQIDDNLKDDTQLIKDGLSMNNYKEIVISNEGSDNNSYLQYTTQLEKFKECVRNLKYKFAIFIPDYITIITRNNTISSYIIKSKQSYIPIETTTLCICVDLENLFENIDSLVEDSIKLYSSFYNVLNEANKKQIVALDSQVKLITDVPRQIELRKNELAKVQIIMNNALNSLLKICKEEIRLINLKDFEERKKMVEQREIRSRETNIEKISMELSKVREQKEKFQSTISNIRKNYHHQLLSFDYNLYKGLHLFHSMTENIKQVL